MTLLRPARQFLRRLGRTAVAICALNAVLLAALPATAQTGAIVSSPVSGIVFQDAPQLLPIDTRFSQAIQTIAIDLGSTCEQVEAYGWTIDPSQQERVNTIFAQTAQELARLGYSVAPQSPSSASADITVYTATHPDRNLLFTWSAGATGLLLLMCETRGDVTPQGFGPGADAGKAAAMLNPEDLVGEWTGTYSCLGQGPTGATMTISRVAKDKDGYSMSGQFSFYPLKDKNPNQPRGSYRLKGRYDANAQRAILEPGEWIQRPSNYYDAVMVAEFNGAQKRLSAVYQGTTGCTSFEAGYKEGSADRAARKYVPDAEDKAAAKAAPKKKKAAAPKPKPAPVAPAEPVVTEPAAPTEAPITEVPPELLSPSTEVVAPPTPTPAMETVAPATPNAVVAPDSTIAVPEKPPVQ